MCGRRRDNSGGLERLILYAFMMNLKYRKNKRKGETAGFTLMEFLIYIGIVVFIMTAMVMMGANIIQGRVEVISMEEVSKNARFSMSKITGLIRDSKEVISANGNSLELANGENIEIYLEEDDIKILRNGLEGQLTTGSVDIVDLSFSEPYPGVVEVEMIIEFYNPSGRQEYEMSRDFQITENVRK